MKWIYRSGLALTSRTDSAPQRRFPIGVTKGRFKMIYDFSSKYVPSKRNIIVFLPPHYWSSKRKFPVVYFHDGNNLFDPRVAFCGNPWKLDYYLDKLWKKKETEEFIVVGIYNTVDRHEEYTPSFDLREKAGGMGSLYLRFIAEELKPVIDKQFRTLKNAKNTCIAGSSLGGLISLYGGFSRPDIFGKIAAVSPSIWWDERFIQGYVAMKTALRKFKNTELWIDMGTLEGGIIEGMDACIPVIDVRNMKTILKANGFDSKNIGYLEIDGGQHTESDWGHRVANIFGFLFKKKITRRRRFLKQSTTQN